MMVGFEEPLPQEFGKTFGIAEIRLGLGGRTMSEFGGVSENYRIGERFDEIPEPLIKADGFDDNLE